MSGPPFALRARDVLVIPPQFSGISSSLEDIFDRLGIVSFHYALNAGVDAPDLTNPGAPLTLADLEEIYGTYDEPAADIDPPPLPSDTPTPAPAFDLGNGLLTLQLKILSDIVVDLPGLDGFSVVLNPGGLQVDVTMPIGNSDFAIAFTTAVAFRFAPNLLRPMKSVGSGADVKFEPDTTKPYVQITAASVTVHVDSDGTIDLTGGVGLHLDQPVMVGETGVIIETADIVLTLSGNGPRPVGTPAGWRGLLINQASIRMPDVFSAPITATGFGMGSGGISGTIGVGPLALSYNPAAKTFAGDLTGKVFGIAGGLKDVSLTFQQNIPAGGSIRAQLALPFFDSDDPLDIDISISPTGFLVGVHSASGLLNLKTPNLFDLSVDAIGFELASGVGILKLSGTITPRVANLKWPGFHVDELSIDSDGNVRLDGGWINLPSQYMLDFHGFKIEISQLGFGKNDDGSKWVGFSGGLKLVEGLQAGASVEGLRITWFERDLANAKITLNGAGVELKIPGVLELKGSVSFRELEIDGEQIKRFDGDIQLKLKTPKMSIDGTMVIGSAKGPQGRYNFFAIYVDVELPTAIQLGATGLAIYNIAGLFALQMEPNKGRKNKDEKWFSIDHANSFYHRDKIGITDLRNKWDPRKGSFAFGAGMKIGTYADDGYTFNGKFLLAIVLPGPIILFQGASSFLTNNDENEGAFRSLAVYDGRAGSFLIGLDAEYKTGKGGEMIEIAGSMEAYYSLHDPTAWHLWLGQKDPASLRIRALLGRFVEANAYFMLDAHQLALGAWFGYSNGWNVGPLSIRLEAWAEGNALISFKPTHFHGDLWLHAVIDLSVFGFGFGIALDARIEADLFKPYHLRGEFSVGVKLPFRKKKLGAKIVLEWGPRLIAPPLPLPLTQVAVEHLKTTTVWPLPRGKYLLPNYDDGGGFYRDAVGLVQPDATELAKVPLVPLDSRISLTFGRSVHDKAKVGSNWQPVNPVVEGIGHPGGAIVATVEYDLDELVLSRLGPNGWVPVAKSPKTDPMPPLYGSWAAVPQLGPGTPGQTKLMLWSKSPFDFTRATGSSWEEWVSDAWPDYPCIPYVPAEETCFEFGDLAAGAAVKSPWTYAGPPRVTLSWGFGPATVGDREIIWQGRPWPVHSLCFPEAAARRGVHIECEPGQSVKIYLTPAATSGGGLFPRGDTEAIFWSSGSAVCVDVREQIAGTRMNPWTQDDLRFAVYGADGALVPQARIERWGTAPLGLNAGHRLDIALPCASPWVELIVTHRPPFRIVAFNGAGAAVATHAPVASGVQTTETIRLEGEGITRLEVHAAGNEKLIHSVCYECTRPSGPTATGHDEDGNPYGPFVPGPDGVIVVKGDEITVVVVTSDKGFCIDRICVTPDVDAGQVVGRDEMIEHIRQELAHWQSVGDLLEPHTTYRLTVRTSIYPTAVKKITFPTSPLQPVEHAYFRTGGPPGITKLPPPEGVDEETFDSGLDDLVRYVKETDPPTVPPPGEKPILYEPFYRAYDLGVDFNEPYVGQMYRMDGRDLGLYVYDNSNQPARDVKGRLLVLSSEWGVAEELTLSEKDTRWITQIDNAKCLQETLDPETFPHSSVIASVDPNRVLAPDTLHEARLVPLLLHETFARALLAGKPPGWLVEDTGAGGPSTWRVGELGEPASRFVEQVTPIGGTTLLLDASSGWTDYRVNVYARSPIRGAIGIVVRHQGMGTGYRFTMDATHLRLTSGAAMLREEHFAYQKNRDYRLSVEVLADMVRASVDGEPIFEVQDAAYAQGRIGLYVSSSTGARFTDVTVDDLRKTAPVAYRYQFTTSKYANFFHHVHSFEDELWSADLGAQDVKAQLDEAVASIFDPPSEREARAYDELATLLLQQAARQNPERVEITRVMRSGAASLFLLRSPEPIDVRRTQFHAARSLRALPAGEVPKELKLTDATLDATTPADESVTVLLREATELTRHRIELRELPGPVAEQVGDPVLWVETFHRPESLERFTIADASGPSHWQWERGAIVETSGSGGGNEPELPGSIALAGDVEWQDYRVTVDLRGDAGGDAGVVFRHRDADNHYRLSLGAASSYRRLVKRAGGVTTVLWEDTKGYAAGEPFRVAIDAIGSRLTAFVDDVEIFRVIDDTHVAGRVGIYAANNAGARCEQIEVRLPPVEAHALFMDAFDRGDAAEWTLQSEATSVPLDEAAQLHVANGALRLDSLIAEGGAPEYPGAYAIAGDPVWTDVILRARVRSAGGVIGVVIRAKDPANYYRFSMNSAGDRLLVKKAGGSTTVLWRDAAAYVPDRTYELTVSAIGGTLRGFIDGVPLFAVDDAEIAAGGVGLFTWNNQQTWFSDVRVWPGTQAFSGWSFEDHFAGLSPDRWSFVGEKGEAEADRWNVEDGTLRLIVAEDGSLLFNDIRLLAPLTFRPHYAIAAQREIAGMRLMARLRLDPAGDSGIVFGWRDPSNHTVLWLGRGMVSLVRTVSGNAETLVNFGLSIDHTADHVVSIDCDGGRIRASVDGGVLFDFDAPAITGRFGFAIMALPTIIVIPQQRFRELLVAEPQWTTLYAFPPEERLPAGTRVQVYASPPAATVAQAGLITRSIAVAGERGRTRLRGSGATLRLVAPDGEPGHVRAFVYDAGWVPIGVKLLRKADGTACFMIPEDGQATNPLRLAMTFLRDRPEAGRTMSQAGDRKAEQATLVLR